ncbi:hypothetical protein POM88_048667 [Heracleum sosnowskyi]|uniref:Uncharacterized protein n=1 Tax=Heracleum sosnowskyi TaxID=360622 RepID=A0AAD8LZU3_9APIA|nr:hypothetical protein POM88_048667 [Heracleum sosnowskyi]
MRAYDLIPLPPTSSRRRCRRVDDESSVRTLSESVVDEVSDLPPDNPLIMRTMRELVQVMVTVLADIKARPRPNSKDKGKMIALQDAHSSSDSDDHEPRAPPSPPAGQRRAAGSIHIRGD